MTDVGKTPPPSLPALTPGALFAGYRIEGILDRGGMGVVYKATDTALDRAVALKIIAPEHTQNPTAVARFKAEARLAASLEHPNIVPIHRGGEHEGILYLAMRLVPGSNLRSVIDRGPVDFQRTARIVSQVADALDTAHGAGLVHRDVKPANILVAGEGDHEHCYLTDFGLTKRLGSAGDLTRTGGWVGTPDYVAPEQIQGHVVDGRADIYSLGCVVYEMLTGQVAYPKDSHMAKLWAHVTDPPPLPRRARPDLVESFDAVVARATAKDPAERFQTAGQLAAAVRAAVGEQEAKRQFQAAQHTRVTPTEKPVSTRDEVFVDARPAEPSAPEPSASVAAESAAAVPTAPKRLRRRRALAVALGVLAFAALCVAAVVRTGGGSSGERPAPAGTDVTGELAPVPLNRVQGVGRVTMVLSGSTARFHINATGLLDGAPHAMHIHAGGQGRCPPGAAAALHGGHLAIFTTDGAPYYGHVVTALTTSGGTAPKDLLAFGRFPKTGTIDYRRTINLGPVVAAAVRQNTSAVVVIHGIDYNHNDTYDNSLDRSDLRRSLPGEETAPALCGALTSAPARGSQAARASRRFTGRLVVAASEATPALLCDLRPIGTRFL